MGIRMSKYISDDTTCMEWLQLINKKIISVDSDYNYIFLFRL